MRVQVQSYFIGVTKFNYIYENFTNVAMTDFDDSILVRFDTKSLCITPEQIDFLMHHFHNVTFLSKWYVDDGLEFDCTEITELEEDSIDIAEMEEEEEEEEELIIIEE